MLIQLNQKQLKLQNELQEYFEAIITPSLKAELSQPEYFEGGGPEFKKAMRTMGSDGWIGLSWKKEFGGKELSPIEQYIFVETVMRTGFPFPFLTTESVGPMIAEYGSKWAKEEIATKILKGELIFGIGYSEPNSGTDLASLQTKAIKQTDGYLINGQKMWTSLANFSDYIWLATHSLQCSNIGSVDVHVSCKHHAHANSQHFHTHSTQQHTTQEAGCLQLK